MIVKFKKLHENAVLPTYAKTGDAGLDMVAVSKEWSDELGSWVYDTGVAVEIPEGYLGFLMPRSSICKKNLILSNSIGLIDSGYRGSVKFIFREIGRLEELHKLYSIGERIGQLVIQPYPTIEPEWAEELSLTERGVGGHGSTGA